LLEIEAVLSHQKDLKKIPGWKEVRIQQAMFIQDFLSG
jgi:hypothetical protein